MRTALALNGEFAEAYVNRGNVLQELLQHEAAIESFNGAIALNSAIAEAFQGRGVSLSSLKRFGQAFVDYSKAIELKPDLAAVHLNRGNLLCELQRHEAAVADCLRATELEPSSVQAYLGLGSAYVHLKKLDLAIASFEKATALDPTGKYVIGACRLAKMQACRWEGLREDRDLIVQELQAKKPVCNPLTLAALIDSPALHQLAAEVFVRDQIFEPREMDADLERIADMSPDNFTRPRSTKIRIGYFSTDLRAHPVAHLTAGLFEHHDRAKFEVTAFAFGPEATIPRRRA